MEITVLDGAVSIDPDCVDASGEQIRAWLAEYERGDRLDFDVAVEPPTPFIGEVLSAMRRIPAGETRTYGALAADLETAPVAVGQACGRNPAPILVPCHRVIGSDGGLCGYSSPDGLALKRRLLEHEGAT
ncbi:MAG: methylated-DNA--[protein]-cysteine S-methyltransferase [Salinirussus sp.]